jgi:ABC-type polysaccharide/polyol phosphate export permease
MKALEKTIKKVMNQLVLLSCYMIILKAFGWLTKGWLFALAPLLAVMAAKFVAITFLFIAYISEKHHGKKTRNQ